MRARGSRSGRALTPRPPGNVWGASARAASGAVNTLGAFNLLTAPLRSPRPPCRPINLHPALPAPLQAMAGLLGASLALRSAHTLLPAPSLLQLDQQQHPRPAGSGRAALLAAVVACDGAAAAAALATAPAVTASVTLPPRTSSHTRRIIVPSYCLSGTRTRRSRSRRLGGGDEEAGGGDDGFGGGGDDGSGGWDGGSWFSDDEGSSNEGSGSTRLQDLLLLWSLWCGLAFCHVLWHVSPKPKPAPAFAALSFSGLKAQLMRSAAPAACAAAS